MKNDGVAVFELFTVVISVEQDAKQDKDKVNKEGHVAHHQHCLFRIAHVFRGHTSLYHHLVTAIHGGVEHRHCDNTSPYRRYLA